MLAQSPLLGPVPAPPTVPGPGTITQPPPAVTQWLDTANREAVRLTYLGDIAATNGIAMGWTGTIAACAEGATTSLYRSAVIQRANWFRGMAGVPNVVTLDVNLVPGDSKAALMMSANGTLNHFPPPSWNCFSAEGYNAASKSNLCLSSSAADAGCVTAYMEDLGSNNTSVGHRRWILYPQTTAFGTGDVDATGFPPTYLMANALQVIQDSTYFNPRPSTRDTFVAWPPRGYVPYQVVFPRWHFSLPAADFSAATVTMTTLGGSSLPVTIESRGPGAGENSIVWLAAGLGPNGPSWPQPTVDTTIRVTVNNVFVNGVPQVFSYDVIIFDPASGGGISLTPPSNPSPASGATGISTVTNLTWTGSPGATSYDVYLFTTVPGQAVNTTSTSYTPPALQPNTTYFWRVDARNGPVSSPSLYWSFTTAAGTSPNSGPVIISPVNNQTIRTGGVTFTWNPVSGSGGYNMKVASGTTPVFEGNLAGGDSTSTLVSLPDGVYTFAIRSCSGGFAAVNCGPSTSVAFTVLQDKPFIAPSITSPSNGAAFNTSTHQFTWTSVPGVSRYEILLRDVGAGGATELSMANAGNPPATNTTFSMKSSISYELTVRACTAACGPWSTPVYFSVTLPSIPTQAPVSPVCSMFGNQANCFWNDVPNADLYVAEAVQGGAGPGGGALTVASSRVSQASAVLNVPNGNMQVLVRACNGNGCGPYSSPAIISNASPNPSVPVLSNPIGGSVVTGPLVFFSWNRIPGDNGSNTVYRLYVQDFSLSRPALDILTRNNYWAARFRAGGSRYDALVIANPGSSQVAGPASPFNVKGNDPASPTLMEPRHQDANVPNAISAAGNVQLGWTPLPGATLYEYYVVKSTSTVPVGRGITPGLNVQIPLAGAGQYSGIVRACPAGKVCTFDSDTNWGPWSSAAGGTGVTTFQVQ